MRIRIPVAGEIEETLDGSVLRHGYRQTHFTFEESALLSETGTTSEHSPASLRLQHFAKSVREFTKREAILADRTAAYSSNPFRPAFGTIKTALVSRWPASGQIIS